MGFSWAWLNLNLAYGGGMSTVRANRILAIQRVLLLGP